MILVLLLNLKFLNERAARIDRNLKFAALGGSCAVDLAERRGLRELVDFGGDMGALVLEKVGDGATQPWIGNIMRRMGRHRHIAARDLVLAAGAGLDAAELALDRVVDRLV